MSSSQQRPEFKILIQDESSYARTGELHLKRGILRTPAFMPVGTHGTVRGLAAFDLESTGADLMLANTYHLLVRPGVDLIERAGGLHSFNAWKKPILTDSGGFQVFSLAEQRKISEEGVSFRNSWNGDQMMLTPESVIRAQETFNSDVMMVLDECPPATATRNEVVDAVGRSFRWARRAKEIRSQKDLALFPILQGGSHLDLRMNSLDETLKIENDLKEPWEGIAIGGLSVGETKEKFVQTLFALRSELPQDRPHYLMGVGTPRDLVFGVLCGMDMFDCVLPSRNGRHGIVMTRAEGRLNLFNSRFTEDKRPLEEGCECLTCKTYSRSFIRHLLVIEDALGGRLATLHNVFYFLKLMSDIRSAIENGNLLKFAIEFLRSEQNVFLGGEKGYSNYPEVFL